MSLQAALFCADVIANLPNSFAVLSVVLCLVLGSAAELRATPCLEALEAPKEPRLREARVVDVIDGRTVVLEGPEKQQVRLVGIEVPVLSGKARLAELVEGKAVAVLAGASHKDRYGRLLAHLIVAGTAPPAQRWVQGLLVSAGTARVFVWPDNRNCGKALLKREAQARAAGAGQWSNPAFFVRTPVTAAAHIGSFQLVEGRVAEVAVRRKRAYLNFGADWRTDFTVSIQRKNLRLFTKENIDLPALKGKRVRIRGWIESYNGPTIEASVPEQLEVLENQAGP